MFDAVLRAARVSRMPRFMWYYIRSSARALLSGGSPRAIVLASPHIPWGCLTNRGKMIQRWATAASVVPHAEDVAQSAVDALLQIASFDTPSRHITPETCSWLTKRPSLPPICLGRDVGTYTRVVEAVRALKDIEVLKSYLLLIWSEWNGILSNGPDRISNPHPHNAYHIESCSFCVMRISIQQDFGGVGMGHHRAELVHRLDHILAQLDRGLEYLKQCNPKFDAYDLHARKNQYQALRDTLLWTNAKAISRASHSTIMPRYILSPGGLRIPHDVCVCASSSMSVVSRPEQLMPLLCSCPRFDVIR